MATFPYRCCNDQPVPGNAMPTMILQLSSPWSVAHEEDKRFYRILVQTLAVSLILGAITPFIRIPQPDTGIDQKLPQRRVQLLAEQPPPAPQPLQFPTTAVTSPAKPQTLSEQPAAAPIVSPSEKAMRSGVLAMGDALAELQASAPKPGARPARVNRGKETLDTPRQASLLTANVNRGSGGPEGGVDNQAVLGVAGWPVRDETRLGSSRPEASEFPAGKTSLAPPSVGRSQEEIQEMLDRNKGAMYTLYNRELRNDERLQGKLVLSITVAPAGNVTRCVILSSELDSASLEQQLVALVTGIDFGNKPGATVMTTKIPIEFFPR
jgi:TonB family protein